MMEFKKKVGKWSFEIDFENVILKYKPKKRREKKLTIENNIEDMADLKHIIKNALGKCVDIKREKIRLKNKPNFEQLDIFEGGKK